jgi:hypothetical protein
MPDMRSSDNGAVQKASREDRRKAQKNGVFRWCSWQISGFDIYVTN